MKILKCTDIIKITTPTEEPVSVYLSPLSVSQKMELSSKMKMVKGEEIADSQAQAFLCIKYCIKKIEGVQNYDGTEYVPEMDGTTLSDSSVDDIMTVLSEASLVLPVILAANKTITGLKDVTVEVNPKP